MMTRKKILILTSIMLIYLIGCSSQFAPQPKEKKMEAKAKKPKMEQPQIEKPNEKFEGGSAYVCFVLDKSGSMEVARRETVQSFNEYVQEIKNSVQDQLNARVSLITFSGQVEPLFLNEDVEKLRELRMEDYVPTGSTAMLDAIGYALDNLKKQPNINDTNTSVTLVIVTDGEENASQEYNTDQIAEEIESLQEDDRWAIVFLGSDNPIEVAKKLNVRSGNVASFSSSAPDGYVAGYQNIVKGLVDRMDAQATGGEWTNTSVTFFGPKKEERKDEDEEEEEA